MPDPEKVAFRISCLAHLSANRSTFLSPIDLSPAAAEPDV
jgi:hypothetical protein